MAPMPLNLRSAKEKSRVASSNVHNAARFLCLTSPSDHSTHRAMRAGVAERTFEATSTGWFMGPVRFRKAAHCDAQPPASVSVPCARRRDGKGAAAQRSAHV